MKMLYAKLNLSMLNHLKKHDLLKFGNVFKNLKKNYQMLARFSHFNDAASDILDI